MILFTYDDGQDSASVTWSEEYGFIVAGNREIINRITFEEIAPRQIAMVPILDVPMREDVPSTDWVHPEGGEPAPARKCFACGHQWHDSICEKRVEGIPCDCSQALA